MWPDGLLVKTSELENVAEAAADFLPKLPRGIARRCVEINMGMPRHDRGNDGCIHGWRNTWREGCRGVNQQRRGNSECSQNEQLALELARDHGWRSVWM